MPLDRLSETSTRNFRTLKPIYVSRFYEQRATQNALNEKLLNGAFTQNQKLKKNFKQLYSRLNQGSSKSDSVYTIPGESEKRGAFDRLWRHIEPLDYRKENFSMQPRI